MDATCQLTTQSVPGMKNKLLGGEGLFHTVITGPGRVVLQTMPISTIAQSIIPFIPTNVEQFLYFSLIGMILEIIKTVVIKESVNILVLIQNIEDKIFVKILMK